MDRVSRVNHISFEISEKNVAIIKLKSSSSPCPEGEPFKVKKINFCLCPRDSFPLHRIKLPKTNLRELSIDPASVVHLSYLYGLIVRRIFNDLIS